MASQPSSTSFTRADLDELPDDGRRYELLDGELLVSPLASRRHQYVVMKISRALDEWADDHGGVVYPGVNVELVSGSHLEPDVAWSSDTDIDGQGFERTPELVVEVLSPGTEEFDRGDKRVRYAASGAIEVWLVDLDTDEVLRFVAAAGSDAAPDVHRRGETVTTPLLLGFAAAVDDLLGPAPDEQS